MARRALRVDTGEPEPVAKNLPLSSKEYPNLQVGLIQKVISGPILSWHDSKHLIKSMRTVRKDIVSWMDAYERVWGAELGFEVWYSDWKAIRLAVGLQFRLLVEQVCYDRGRPWRNAVTGFRPA